MRKPLALVAVICCVGWTSSSFAASLRDLVASARACIDAVSSQGVDVRVLEGSGFVSRAPTIGEEPASFGLPGSDLQITFPDEYGGRAICVVSAGIASVEERERLEAQISRTWGRSIDQGESVIWMFNHRRGMQGLQLWREGDHEAPRVRLIAAHFGGGR